MSIFLEEEIHDRYLVGQLLGKGTYAHVYEAVEKRKGQKVALKVMGKENLGDSGMDSVRNEISVMKDLQHPLMLHLNDNFSTPASIVLELELVTGGELFKRIIQLKHYSEQTACKLMFQVCRAVEYMHSQNIVHRDLKPDNILLLDKDSPECTDIKIADFGFATRYKGQVMTKACGTPYYIAPEVLQCGVFKARASYNQLCDMWSVGVIAYVLLSGYPPFRADDKGKLFRCIVGGHFKFHSGTAWDKISKEAQDFITALLVLDPSKRLTAKDALKHKWFTDCVCSNEHLGSSQEGIQEIDSKGKFRAAVYGVEAAFRLLYLAHCTQSGIKENTGILDTLASATEPLTTIDLSNNYLGTKGLQLLIELLLEHSNVQTLILRNAIIETEQAVSIAVTLRDSKTSVTSLDFSQNPLSHAAARAMLATMQVRRRIIECNFDQTGVSDGLKRRVAAQAEANKEYTAVMSARLPALVSSPPVPPVREAPSAPRDPCRSKTHVKHTASQLPRVPQMTNLLPVDTFPFFPTGATRNTSATRKS